MKVGKPLVKYVPVVNIKMKVGNPLVKHVPVVNIKIKVSKSFVHHVPMELTALLVRQVVRILQLLVLLEPMLLVQQRVRPVRPLPTPLLSNAPLVLIKKLPPVMLDILGLPVMLFVKHVLPVPLRILEPVPGQQRVLLVRVVRIHYRQTLRNVRLVPVVLTALLVQHLV